MALQWVENRKICRCFIQDDVVLSGLHSFPTCQAYGFRNPALSGRLARPSQQMITGKPRLSWQKQTDISLDCISSYHFPSDLSQVQEGEFHMPCLYS